MHHSQQWVAPNTVGPIPSLAFAALRPFFRDTQYHHRRGASDGTHRDGEEKSPKLTENRRLRRRNVGEKGNGERSPGSFVRTEEGISEKKL